MTKNRENSIFTFFTVHCLSPAADQVSNTGTTQLGGIVMTSCQDQTISAALAVEVNCEKVLVQDTEYIPAAPATLRFEQELKQQYEGGEFIVQPKLRAYDTEVCYSAAKTSGL